MSRHHQQIKNDPRWKAARAACFARDDYTCVDCGTTEDLQADHLLELAEHPDLAFEVDNLATRCGECNRRRYHANTEKGAARSEWASPRFPELLAVIERARSFRDVAQDPRSL